MSLSISEIVAATMILFAVIDIIGSIPVILDIKRKAGLNPLKATVASFLILIAFLFGGEKIIQLIGIDINSFAVAGSFVLLFLSLEMILGIKLFKDEVSNASAASVVPVAFPLLAGAGTMTSIISIRAAYGAANIVVAIILNMLLVYVVLRNTHRIERLLGEAGMAVIKKVFGIILMAIAVKLFAQNAPLIFQSS